MGVRWPSDTRLEIRKFKRRQAEARPTGTLRKFHRVFIGFHFPLIRHSQTPRLASLLTAICLTMSLPVCGWARPRPNSDDPQTTTPIKHVVVIFQENVSFDHYFATYPYAQNETAGEPKFIAKDDTPGVNNLLSGGLLTNNPNATQPFRLSRAESNTCNQNHNYLNEQEAVDHGLVDNYVAETGSVDSGKQASTTLFWDTGMHSHLQRIKSGFWRRLAGNFKFEMERGNFISGMVVRICQLGHAVEELVYGGRALINAREQIDQMSAGLACRAERNDHVALRIEAAGISHISVIVGRGIKVVVLRPSDSMQVNRHRRSSGTRRRLHAHDAGLDSKISARKRFLFIAQFQAVLAAQIQRNRQREFDLSVASNFYLRDCPFLRRESIAAHAAPHIRLPKKIECRAGWKTFAAQNRFGADNSLGWAHAQLSILLVNFRCRQRIGLVFVRIHVRGG